MGLLEVHQRIQHGKLALGRRNWATTASVEEPRTYKIYFPTAVGQRKFTVKGFRGRAATQKVTNVHFLRRHVRDTVIILEEGNLPHTHCPCCNILVPWKALNRRHITTAQCAKGAEQKRRRLRE